MNKRSARATRVALFLCGTLLVPVFGVSAQGDSHPRFTNAIAQARATALTAISSGQGNGVTMAIMEHGRFVYSEGIGVADRERNRPVDRDTRFNVGSVAKMFAAVSLLLLMEDGKVELDAPVTRYIPEFTMADPRYRDITVRMLLNHSAGLPGVTVLVGFEPDPTAQAVLLETLKGSRLKHRPGAMSLYSNDGFTLAEIVIERISGRRYMDFLAERIFLPLGMMHTGASVGELGEVGDDNVAEYYEAKTDRKYPREVVPVYAAGGISSTAEDLCRFGNALMPGGTPLLSPASLQTLMQPQPASLAASLRHTPQFGEFGWDYIHLIGAPAAGVQVLAKGGNTGFYASNLQVLPAQGLVVALITSGQASGDKLTQPILIGLLQDRQVPVATNIADPPAAQPIPAALDRYRGYYASETGALAVSIDAARQHVTFATPGSGGPPLALTYADGYLYRPDGGEIRFYFVTVDGEDLIVANAQGLITYDTVMFTKVDPVRRPRTLSVPMHNEPWLIRNAPASVEFYEGSRPMLTSRLYKEIPGYVDFDGLRRIDRPDFAAIAATALRDQSDLSLVSQQGDVWMRTANILRSPARHAPKLARGSTSVTIGREGYNEWRAVDHGAGLRLVLPHAGVRVVIAAADVVLHDSLVDGNDAYAPGGSYLFFAGGPGDTLHIEEQPALAFGHGMKVH